MHHTKGGLYFERQVDGSVKVVLKRTQLGQTCGGVDWPDVAFEVVLRPLIWASVVAAVSKRGQVVDVIEEALRVHEEGPTAVPPLAPKEELRRMKTL